MHMIEELRAQSVGQYENFQNGMNVFTCVFNLKKLCMEDIHLIS
jgi:hypothetical protein